jgi:hypothetical protein
VVALSLSETGASGAASVARYKVISVSGKLEAHVTAGYGAFQCPGKTPSLFTGNIHGRRPGKPATYETQYGTAYNNLFKASIRRSHGSFNPATGRGTIRASVHLPIVSGGTGERVGCHPYQICQDHNETPRIGMLILLEKIGRRGALLTWEPGGATNMPRDRVERPHPAVGVSPMYNCLDTYYPFVLEGKSGKFPCRNKAPKPGTLAKNVFVLHLKCAYNRPEFHPYTDGDGTRNVTDRASIEANFKVKRIN